MFDSVFHRLPLALVIFQVTGFRNHRLKNNINEAKLKTDTRVIREKVIKSQVPMVPSVSVFSTEPL